MLMKEQFERVLFSEIIDEVFRLNDRTKSKNLLQHHSKLWTQMQSGSQGLSGKRTINALTSYNMLFEEESVDEIETDFVDSDDEMVKVLGD
jgi:hypothetical protein